MVQDNQLGINPNSQIRHDWSHAEVKALFDLPFNDLMFKAQTVHRENFNPNEVQVSTLLSIKTGACPEDCKYCSQSARYNTDIEKERLMEVEKVLEAAKIAKEQGSTRFCMGAGWRNPKARDMPYVVEMVKGVKAMGLETCMTLGMIDSDQAGELQEAGLDYYNHNLDTSPEHYNSIITTRSYQDRLDTLQNVRDAGMKVCSGGIVGLGEKAQDRVSFLAQLANLPKHPDSVPINMLVKIAGTPLADVDDLDHFDFIRCIAVARIMMPKSHVRLSAGRDAMNEQMQSMCFLAGANSIFYGCKLLTTGNPEANKDMQLFAKLGINTETVDSPDQNDEKAIHTAVINQQNSELFYDATQA
ncbi:MULTISPECIES: biotin synthase BioB [Thalassotalea]|uniref:Biotin synthase n=1 Tax=Thalassotalea castellviae TaxID=3075612 RepID=A0ABU2ZXJ9_9GAMM|nr:biotin synthase BioB [Thalassotalea sp. W431]MDT0602042.1 biotin synthase BioB [Thalassotalea sp. W431]